MTNLLKAKRRRLARPRAEGRRVTSQDMKRLAKRLNDDCHEAHRGAFWLDKGNRVAVAFGNDGHNTDERAQLEVEAVRRVLADCGGKEVGFATAADGYTWALACKLPSGLSPEALEGVLWTAWNGHGRDGKKDEPGAEPCAFQLIQQSEAEGAILKLGFDLE